MSGADRARALLQEVAEERRRGSQIRMAVSAVVLAMFGIFAYNIYSRITGFDTEKLLAELQTNAARTVWPMVVKELDTVGQAAVPAISDAMLAELEKMGPKLQDRVSAEAKLFETHMNEAMQKSLDAHLATEFKRNESELKGKLPEFTADSELYDDLVRRLRKSSQDWAMTQLDTTFAEHITIMQSINDSVQKLGKQAAEDRTESGDASMDDVMLLVAEILNARVNEGG